MDEIEFLDLIRQNRGIIYKLVSLYATDAEDRKDLYQEILLQAWKSVKGFRHDAKFSTWLYRVSLNTILTQKRKRTALKYNRYLAPYEEPLYEQPGAAEEINNLLAAIRQFPEADRGIISMNLDGYTNEEIALVLGISANNVAVKLHRIRRKLSNILKQER